MKKQIEVKNFEFLINGKIQPMKKDEYVGLINPSNGGLFAMVSDANIQDMRAAIVAACEAFDHGPWPQMTLPERGIYLKKIAQLIRTHAKELAELESLSVGKTTKQSTFIGVPTCADTFDYFSNIDQQLNERLQNDIWPKKRISKS